MPQSSVCLNGWAYQFSNIINATVPNLELQGNHVTVKVPDWADVALSEALPSLCAQDESQTLEFKERIPPQLHDLGKAIAAFASSNDGTILLGVDDSGQIVGLEGCLERGARDKIQRSVTAAVRAVEPPVLAHVGWAVSEGRAVCVVLVKRGAEAIYYSNERPIIRDGNSSRAASAGEVGLAHRKQQKPELKATDLASTRDIAKRLRTVLKAMNQAQDDPLTVSDLAAAMTLSAPSELDSVMSGHRDPTFELLRCFCQCFAVSYEWLIAGRGKPFRSQVDYARSPEQYLAGLEQARITTLYVVRSTSAYGEAFFIAQTDDLKFEVLPQQWHVSHYVGATGASDLLNLYRIFEGWKATPHPYSVVGRKVGLPLAKSLWEGEAYPGVVRALTQSEWWMDLTDIDHSWTTRDRVAKDYGGSFVRAQDFIRAQLEGKPLPY